MSITRSLNQLVKIFDPHHPVTPLYHTPQTKPSFPNLPVIAPLPHAKPEEQGVSSRVLAGFLTALNRDPTLNMHGILVIRRGHILLDFHFRGYDTSIWRYTYSACKSIVSLAIGVLIDRGMLSLSDKLESYLPQSELTPLIRLKIKDIKIEDLLTMSTGASFNEITVLSEENWLRGFLSGTFKGNNDTLFEYNSMNTYVLSYLITRISGMSLSDFLKDAFFTPMGIVNVFFEKCPQGIEKGGWGLYITPQDFAKFGILILNGGVWEGKRLISGEYLRLATSLQRRTPESYGDFHYGYQMWVGRDRDTILFNGMHGQNMLIDRTNELVIVSYAGNNEMFQNSSYFKHLSDFFFTDRFPSALPADPDGEALLSETMKQIHPTVSSSDTKSSSLLSRLFGQGREKKRDPLSLLRPHLGVTLYPTSDHSSCMGLFPRLMQITHGLFTSGLSDLSLQQDGERLILLWNEKEQKIALPLGFSKPTVSEISFGEAFYLIGAEYRIAKDEYGQTVLMIRADVLETPYTRLIKLRFLQSGGCELSLDERPGSDFILDLGMNLTEDLRTRPLIGSALNKLDRDYLEFLIGRVIEPKLYLSASRPRTPSEEASTQEKRV